jgi:hypothetical protein
MFSVCFVSDLTHGLDGSLGFAYDIRVPEFQLAHLSGENPLFFFDAFEFRSRGDPFL